MFAAKLEIYMLEKHCSGKRTMQGNTAPNKRSLILKKKFDKPKATASNCFSCFSC